MSEVLLFHHAHGLTEGVTLFADDLRAEGHVVHTPDLFEGHVFADLDEGVAFAKSTGFEVITERGAASAAALPAGLVYAGFSLGVMPAQMLAQTRPGAKGAVLMSAALAPEEFGPWPEGVALQVHMMEHDPWGEEDIPVARELVALVEGAELFLYPGDAHLFADPSLDGYTPAAAALLLQRVLDLLDRVG